MFCIHSNTTLIHTMYLSNLKEIRLVVCKFKNGPIFITFSALNPHQNNLSVDQFLSNLVVAISVRHIRAYIALKFGKVRYGF